VANILVVDDDETDRLAFAAMLEGEGHDVVFAANGDEALDLYMQRRIHLVVTDMVMPERDGLALISSLRGVDPNAVVIAVSGQSPSQLQASTIFGARAVLTKPVDREAFLGAVREAVGGGESAST